MGPSLRPGLTARPHAVPIVLHCVEFTYGSGREVVSEEFLQIKNLPTHCVPIAQYDVSSLVSK